jgi:hypothetical protein
MIRQASIIAVLFAALVAAAPGEQPGAMPVKPIATWSGKIADMNLQAKAGDGQVITDAAAFKALWAAWRPKEDPPNIDFASTFVLVGTGSGPNGIGWQISLDPKGDLTHICMQTLIAGPGFCYSIAQISREGVKTVKGKALAAPATAPATAPAK